MRFSFAVLFAALVLVCNIAMSQTTANPSVRPSSAVDFEKLVDQYFDHYFGFHPTDATAAGFHQYDEMLEDYSAKSRQAEIAFFTGQKQIFAEFPHDYLDGDQRADLALVLSSI